MICPKCGYECADTQPVCPQCGQVTVSKAPTGEQSPAGPGDFVRVKFSSILFRFICVVMSVTVLLYLCSGRLGLFWLLFAVAGWITCSGRAPHKHMTAGLQFYQVVLKILQITMWVLSGLFALLAVAILVVGSFTGDTWLVYLAGVSTEYGAGMIPVAALGRLLDAVVPLGGMLAVVAASVALLGVAAAVFLMAWLLTPVRQYMHGLQSTVLTGNPMPRQTFRADVSLMILGTVQALYALTYINQGNIIGLPASLCAAVSLFLYAALLRR